MTWCRCPSEPPMAMLGVDQVGKGLGIALFAHMPIERWCGHRVDDVALYGLSAVPLYQCYQSVILFPTRNFVC